MVDTHKLHALDPFLHPFGKEVLEVEDAFVEHFYQLLTEAIEPPFAISLDGLWGTGKTTIMQRLQYKLEEDEYPTFWFNPWEYSQTEHVALAFLQCLASTYQDSLKKIAQSGQKIFQVLLKAGIGAALKIYTKGNVSLQTVEEDLKSIEGENSPSYEVYENSVETIKTEFVELIERISQDHHNKPVIIFFDDLDRCLPQNAIQLLEALKNLFVVSFSKNGVYKTSHVIFICGIDTRVAKQFIKKHYHELEDTFAVNYFRKIFNLTLSMPYNLNIESILQTYIRKVYPSLEDWDDPDGDTSAALATIISNLGKKAKLASVRKYLNVVHNFYVFQRFNPKPAYVFKPKEIFILYLLILKEAQQTLYERLVQDSLQHDLLDLEDIVKGLQTSWKGADLTAEQTLFLQDYVLDEHLHFHDIKLAEWLLTYPTLA